jgi:hypothetical protein
VEAADNAWPTRPGLRFLSIVICHIGESMNTHTVLLLSQGIGLRFQVLPTPHTERPQQPVESELTDPLCTVSALGQYNHAEPVLHHSPRRQRQAPAFHSR